MTDTTSSEEIKGKTLKTLPFNNISGTLSLIEEITEKGMFPIALIGVAFPKEGEKKIECWFATISDDDFTHTQLLQMCAALLESKGYQIVKPEKS